MKKKLLFLTFLPVLVLVFLFSCQKNNDLLKEATPTTKNEPAPGHNGNEVVTLRSDYEITDCPYQLGLVTKTNGRLVFQDREHFEKCTVCLENKYEAHNNTFDSTYSSATALQLDSLAALTGFNEWYTYASFENSLSFSSLRAKIKTESETFLDSEYAERIDLTQDPDALCPVFRTSERSLLNEDGEVMVDDTIKTMEDDWAAKVLGDCAALKFKDYLFTEDDNPVLEIRQLRMRIGIISGFGSSKLYGQIKYYKRDPTTGKFKSNVRADMKVAVHGYGYDLNCDLSASTFVKSTPWKKRTQLDVTDWIFLNFRQAFVDMSDPAWVTDRCVVDGYLFSSNNYFPFALED